MSKIAVFFPGIGYHTDKPLLYHARKLADEVGYQEQILVNYVYDGGNIKGNPQLMREAFEILYAQAEEQLSKLSWETYDDILFVSKSIGTVIATQYAIKHQITGKNVFYTPLEQTLCEGMPEGVAFSGLKDPWVNPGEVKILCGKHKIPLYTYPKANHSLETGDTFENLRILVDVMEKIRQYLAE
ncbi:MAG: alpha/beta hydrolase [Acetatifactor sp.]|nr:alpha/beta hydrolase [Acetatifactor sp.]